jgi:hypothetical protein
VSRYLLGGFADNLKLADFVFHPKILLAGPVHIGVQLLALWFSTL